MKERNKHMFTIGFTGRCKRSGNMISGRLQLAANDYTHAIARATEFYSRDFVELEIYGCHLATDIAA
jgi:hypothetical protein